MTCTITIKMDNAAFEESPASTELARILRRLAHQVEVNGSCRPGDFATAYDINGNNVGKLEIV